MQGDVTTGGSLATYRARGVGLAWVLASSLAAVCGWPSPGYTQSMSPLVPLAAGGMDAPGVTGGIFLAGFTNVFGPPVVNRFGEVAFYGTIARAGDPDRTSSGIWVGRRGSLRLAVLTGEQAPGLPAGVTFRSLSTLPGLDDRGCVSFAATLAGPGIDGDTNAETVWTECAGHLEMLARQGSAAPGLSPDVLLSAVGGPQVGRGGTIAFAANLQGPGVDPGNDLALFVGIPGAFELLIREGDALPGQPADMTFRNLSYPFISLNSAGQAALLARLSGPGGESGPYALLLGRPGNVQVVARQGTGTPDGGEFGEIGGGFSLNDAGQVAFSARVSTGGSGLYVGRPGTLRRAYDAPGSLGRTALNGAGEVAVVDAESILGGSPDGVDLLVTGGVGVLLDDPTLFENCDGADPNGPACIPSEPIRGPSSIWGWDDAGELLYTSRIEGRLVPFGYDSLWHGDMLLARTRAFMELPGGPFPVEILRIHTAALSDSGAVATLVFANSTRSPEVIAVLEVPEPGDGDGIDAPVDGRFDGVFTDDSAVSSNHFTDQPRGGTSSGAIVDRSDLVVLVRDAIHAVQGLNVAAAGAGTGTATVDACGFAVRLDAADSAVVTCGSLTVEVLVGPVEIRLATDLVVRISEGAIAHVADVGDGGFRVANVGRFGNVAVISGGSTTSLGPGETTVASVAQNRLPVAHAGSDLVAEATSPDGAWVHLDGSGSVDPDPEDALAYSWSGPFGEALGIGPSVRMPLGTSAVTLRVTDLAGASALDAVLVTVRDTTPPQIEVGVPTAATYTVHQAVAVRYTCTDAVSLLTSCAGPGATGTLLDTASPGTKVFTVDAADAAGNVASRTVSYTVAYAVRLLYDPGQPKKSGSTIPVKIQLSDAFGRNVSAAAVAVTAVGLVRLSDSTTGEVEDPGHANPDGNFRFDPALGGNGGYQFNLKTTGLLTGTYALAWTASGDPTLHPTEVQFQVR
jgi:hypothetical protein